MRILMLALDVPATPRAPGSPRVYDLMRGLKAQGHALALVCGVRNEARWQQFLREDGGVELLERKYPVANPMQLSQVGRARNLISSLPAFDMRLRAPNYFREMTAAVECATGEFRPDVLHVDHLGMAQYVPHGWRGTLVIDAHDAISLTEARKLALEASGMTRTAQQQLAKHQIAKIKKYEAAMARRADAYVVNAEPDRDYLARFIPPEKLHTIPNGVDTDYYHPSSDIKTECQVVFTGAFSYTFNVDAMLYFHARVLPRIRQRLPDLKLMIVGATPPAELVELARKDPLTTVTGFVEDVRPSIWESAVFICPLRGGTGMKNKLLNAMALGKPIVATPISADGLGVRDGEQMLLAESDEAFSDAVVRVMQDALLAARLGAAGREFVAREFGYAKLAARYQALYSRFV